MDTAALVGQTIGHYVILEQLGEGGMGVVYKARDTRLGRIAALKVMRASAGRDSEGIRRFVREAQSASALNHPNILTIYEIDQCDGVDYISTEYIAAPTLGELLASGALPVERALRIAAQVAEALVAAHSAHVVHRDLKPSNIMVLPDDRVKVVDFGLAKFIAPPQAGDDTVEALTAHGVIVGTAAYMSPEQATDGPVDARSDLFSFGTILYEMLAGRPPFAGRSSAATIAAILRDTPGPIAGIAPQVAAVVDRCLRKNAEERFQSSAELKAAIDACLGAAGRTRRPSMAVLPFTNMSGEKSDDYLCEGLAEEITGALTRISGLRVVARTSAFVAAAMGLDIRDTGARLDVSNVLIGSVRRAGSRVRVTAQLVAAGDGAQLWSERYDRELTDVFVLEEEVAAEIAARLRVELGDEARPQRPSGSVGAEAHHAFLEGRYYFARGTPDALARAKSCFETAIACDPGYALAYDSLAELYWYLGFFGGQPPRDAFSQSTWYALRALELDDGLAETHALLGMLRKELDYNWPEVDRELSRAGELNAQSPLVRLRHAISGLMPRGRVEEAMSEIEGVLDSDPLSLFVRWWLAVMAFLSRRFDRCADEGRHMIALDPTHFLGHWVSGVGLAGLELWDETVSVFQQAHELSGGIPFTRGFLAWAYGRAGRRKDAHSLLEEMQEAQARTYIPPFTIALAHIGLSDWDAAFEWMDRAIEMRDPLIMPVRTYPFLDAVRTDPRYGALLRKMNLS